MHKDSRLTVTLDSHTPCLPSLIILLSLPLSICCSSRTASSVNISQPLQSVSMCKDWMHEGCRPILRLQHILFTIQHYRFIVAFALRLPLVSCNGLVHKDSWLTLTLTLQHTPPDYWFIAFLASCIASLISMYKEPRTIFYLPSPLRHTLHIDTISWTAALLLQSCLCLWSVEMAYYS